ncbi:MAG: HAMP domain-containing histidine kinase [Myxococcales bacterium]|nr:HAMP domain-containing histidine kinase [Myxococcales bacterium]
MVLSEGLIRLLEHGVPESLRGDVDARRRAQMAIGVSAAVTIGCLLIVAPVVIALRDVPERFVAVFNTLLTAALAAAAIPLLRRRDGLMLAGNWLAGLLFAGSLYAAFMGGGLASPFLSVLLALPVIAGIISGRASGWVWAALVIAVILVFALADHIGLAYAPLPPEVDGTVLLTGSMITVTAILTLFVSLSEATRRDAIARLSAAVEDQRRSRELASEAVAASAAKSAFLATMSHELRTPLNIILGYSEIVLENLEQRGDEEDAEDLRRIRGAGEHLLGLISDILDLSRIEAHRMSIAHERFEIGELVRDLVISFQPLAERNDTRLGVTTEDELVVSDLDRTRVRQILINLVNNAIKFTRGGKVEVRAARVEGERVQIEVADNGIGIRADKLAAIFQPFTQADQSTTRRYEGTGLGLTIARKLTRLMGGSLTVKSAHGKGSTFTVRLPMTRTSHPGPTDEGDE